MKELTGSAGAPAWTWAVPVIVGMIALAGVIATAYIANLNMTRQIRSAHTLKIAEMRQTWINNLRDAMAAFQSYGVTPDLDHRIDREFYEKGTKIELLINPNDPDYEALHCCMYAFLSADGIRAKYNANPNFVAICQRILKREWDVLKREVQNAEGIKPASPPRAPISNGDTIENRLW